MSDIIINLVNRLPANISMEDGMRYLDGLSSIEQNRLMDVCGWNIIGDEDVVK